LADGDVIAQRLGAVRSLGNYRHRSASQPQPMNFPDHLVAINAAEFFRNLAGGTAFVPEFSQKVYPFFCPSHGLISVAIEATDPSA